MVMKNDNDNDNENNENSNLSSIDIEGIRTVFVLCFFYERYFKCKKQTKALQVTFIHTIYTNKSTSSNFYPYNIHKQKHFK